MKTNVLKIGMTNACSVTVAPENTAAAAGSGLLPVFSTPHMIGLMENAAAALMETALDEGEGSVGGGIEVSHSAATPIGMTVTATAELVSVERRHLVFRVTARDDAGIVGEGVHDRFIINKDAFMQKALQKKSRG